MPSDETKKNPLNLRRKFISAESFSLGKNKIGTILNGIDIVDRRSLNNSRKITSLKNIFKSKDSNLSEKLKSIDPERLDLLKNLDDLIATVRSDQKLKDAEEKYNRKKKEKDTRAKEESRLETRFKKLSKTAQKIVAPVKGVLDRILKFFITLVTGKFLVKLVTWLSDPNNQKKVSSIIRFLGDFGPKLLGLYILFGTRFGKAIRKLSSVIIRGGMRLGAATLLLLRKMGFKRAGTMARSLLGRRGGRIATGLKIGAAAAGLFGISSLFGGGFDDGDDAPDSSEVDSQILDQNQAFREAKLDSPQNAIGLTLVEELPFVGGILAQAGEQNILEGRNAFGFFGGGKVEGPSGIDKVPAMLTEGEFVMSRGAVQKIGVENLMRMNASGGGTNVPRIVNNTMFAQGGGPVGEPMIPDPTALTVLRASGMASRQGLQGTRGMGGRGLGGTLELGYHGTSQSAGRSIRQGGFLPGSRRNTFGTRNVFAAPTSNINAIPSAAQAFSKKGGSAGRGAIERFMDTFKSSKAGDVGDLIPLAMSQGSGPGTRLPFNAFGLSEMSTSADKASKGARLVQNAMTKYTRSRKAQQLLNMGRTTAQLGPIAKVGRALGRFIPGLNIGLGAAETAIRASEGDELGATLAAASMVPGPTGMAAAAGLIIHDVNKAFPTSSIRGRSGAKMAKQNPSVAIPGPPSRSQPQIIMVDEPESQTLDLGESGSEGGLSFTSPTLRNRSSDKMSLMGIGG